MAKKLTHWLLFTLVLSLGFGQLLRFEVFGLPLYFHDLLVISILLLQSLTFKDVVNNFSFKLILLGLALGWMRALTMFPLASLLLPFLYTIRLFSYLALFLSFSKSKQKLPRYVYLCSGLVSLFIGLAQYFLLPDMRIFQYLGWDDHLYRLTLPHFDPTFSAAMLSLYFLSLSRPRAFTLTFLYILGILLSYSRSIWLSLVTTGLLLLKKKKVLLLLLISLPLVIFSLPRRFGEGTNLLRTYSISSRLSNDLTLSKKVGFNFILGQGYNTIPLVFQPASMFPFHSHGFNNSFMEILATTGIIGLAGWIVFLTNLSRKPRLQSAVTFLSLASFFNNLLLYPFTLLLLLLLTIMVPNES